MNRFKVKAFIKEFPLLGRLHDIDCIYDVESIRVARLDSATLSMSSQSLGDAQSEERYLAIFSFLDRDGKLNRTIASRSIGRRFMLIIAPSFLKSDLALVAYTYHGCSIRTNAKRVNKHVDSGNVSRGKRLSPRPTDRIPACKAADNHRPLPKRSDALFAAQFLQESADILWRVEIEPRLRKS